MRTKQFQLSGLLCFLLILYFPLGFTQDKESSKETEPKDVDVPSGQEVEINEDNYRQFMELRDARDQRNMLPENAFKPGSGAQKLDKLPEESQKHLRNQLREIIMQGDQWQPGDEIGEHPYVPSAAASTDASLAKQETEAWGELVENYHQREAQIYENSARSQAAKSNAHNAGQGGEGQESSQPTQGEQGGAADSYSPNAQNDPNATSTQGVSQNAMEFLSEKGSQVAQAGEMNNGEMNNGDTNDGAGESAQNDSQGGEQAQQGSESQNQPGSNSAESTTATSTAQLENESTTGASQNALEYLTGGQEQTSQDETMPLPGRLQGTLSIQDLINAQGVGNTPDNDPDKDTDG